MKLYEVSDQYLSALEQLGDLQLDEEVVSDTLEAITGELEEKAINVAKYFQNLDAEIKAIDDAMGMMKQRKEAMKRHSESLKGYLKSNMERTGITKISCPYFELAVVKNPASVSIDDESQLPEDVVRVKTVKTPDKTEIKKRIQNGEEVPGAHLIDNATRLRIK